MDNTTNTTPVTLESIAQKKAMLLQEIRLQKEIMTGLTQEIFAPLEPATNKANAMMRAFNTGMAVFDGEKIQITKAVGRLKVLEELTHAGATMPGTVGIGHTRWATHGEPSETNAHPHVSDDGNVVAVHNGIIENYQELAAKYGFGDKLSSQTDTEVVAALLDYYYEGDPGVAVFQTVRELKGTFALAVLFEDIPDTIYAIRNVSPIIAGVGKDAGESFLASDVTALTDYVEQYFVLPEYTLAALSEDGITLTNDKGEIIEPKMLRADWKIGSTGKCGYDYYMEKEIMEQPRVMTETLLSRLKGGLPDFTTDQIPDSLWTQYDKITIIGCGTAMHAGLVAKGMLQGILGIPTTVEIASEFIYEHPVVDDRTLVIAISQSGETIDTLEALRYARRKGAGNVSIVNVKGSTITRESQYVFYTNAGPEIAVASTKAYTTQLMALYLIACRIGYVRGNYTKQQAKDFIQDMKQLPSYIEKILENREQIHELAGMLQHAEDVFMMGRGLDYTALLEGSLKLKEISYIHSEAYAGGELKHGTISLIVPGTSVIAICTYDPLWEKMVSNIREVKARGAKVLLITRRDAEHAVEEAERVLYIPDCDPLFAAIPLATVLQLLAYHVAAARGCDIDKPRNLAKSVTVE